MAGAVRKLGGAHFHGTLRMAVAAGTALPAADADGAITTTTDVWLDRTGNYRMVEANDHDGGREVILHGRDLYVALRYGKMIRRVAEQPEPDRLLQEGLGGPWAAWQMAAPAATVERAGTELLGGAKAVRYRVALADHPAAAPPAPVGLRQWRGTVVVQKLQGQLWIDDASGALMKSELSVAFTGQRDDQPVAGTLDVRTAIDGAASTAPIARPTAPEELALRQRIVPEQKELLGGLTGSGLAAPAPAPPKGSAATKAPRTPAAAATNTKGKHP
jgi:hypothetical protein